MKTSVLRGMQYQELKNLERQLSNRLRDSYRTAPHYEIVEIQTNIAWVQKVREEKEMDSSRSK